MRASSLLSLLLVACGPAPGPGPAELPPAFAEVDATGLDLSGAEASASITLPQGDGPVIRTVFLVVPSSGALTCGDEVAFDASLSLRIQSADGSTPGPGTYAVMLAGEAPTGDAAVVNGIGCNPVGGVRVSGGTLTLDAADDEVVEGSLEVTLEEGAASGSFRAHVCDDEPLFTCQ